MSKRLFVAINFDPATRLAIARLMVGLPNHPGLSKTKVDNLHLTLLFLGDTEEDLIPQISQQLDEICQNIRPLSLKFGKLGGFPDLNHPQVVWVGLEGEGLVPLRQTITDKLLPLVPTADAKPFHPHLTIARTNASSHPELAASPLAQTNQQPVGLSPVLIPQIDLLESILASGGSIHRRVSAHSLHHPGPSTHP